ncbi:GMC oxidoreductase [Streptomyces sp. NPDC055186]
MRLESADSATPPRIDYGFLSTPDDSRRLREAVRVTAALLDTPPLIGISPGLLDPRPDVLDDDRALDRWIREHLGTAQHTCGTVPMGPADDPERAAVDQFGRVHGVRGSRVADTSILLNAPHRGPPPQPSSSASSSPTPSATTFPEGWNTTIYMHSPHR